MIHLISYDLRKAGRDYQPLYAALKELGATRVQSSVWVVRSEEPPTALYDKLIGTLDQSMDRLLVIPVNPDASYRSFNGANKLSAFRSAT